MSKSCRIIDGKPKWIIVDENGKIVNRNPSKEDLKGLNIEIGDHGNTRKEKYNETNTCEFIETDGERCTEKLCPGNARQFNINGKIVWYCEKHSGRYRATLPNSQNNTRKLIANFRNNNLSVESPSGKGYISQKVTCIVRGIEDLNIKNDNFHSEIDHSKDSELGIIQSKSSFFNSLEGYWSSHVENEHNKNFDFLFYYCLSNNGKTIEQGYIFPKFEIMKSSSVTIYKDPMRGYNRWYDKYRIKDIKPYNDAYQQILKEIEEGKDNVIRRGD